MSARVRRLAVASLMAAAVVSLLAWCFLQRTVSARTLDPTGRYIVEVSYRSWLGQLPMTPGSSSDKPGFVEIFDAAGDSMGRLPVPMLQMAGVRWEPPGASIDLIGEWDFARRTAYHWDEAGHHKVFVKGSETP